MRQQKYKFRIFKFSPVLLDFSLERFVKIRENRIHFSFLHPVKRLHEVLQKNLPMKITMTTKSSESGVFVGQCRFIFFYYNGLQSPVLDKETFGFFALDIGFVAASPNRHYGRAFISLFFSFWSVRQILHWIKICHTTSVSCQFEHLTSGQNQLTYNL